MDDFLAIVSKENLSSRCRLREFSEMQKKSLKSFLLLSLFTARSMPKITVENPFNGKCVGISTTHCIYFNEAQCLTRQGQILMYTYSRSLSFAPQSFKNFRSYVQ